MARRHHHHYHHVTVTPASSGELHPVQAGVFIFIGIVSGIVWGFNNFIHLLSNWRQFPAPYKYVAAFYDYTLAHPYYLWRYIWYRVGIEGFTQYPNINLILGSISIIFYILSLLMILGVITGLFNKYTKKPGKQLFSYFLMPAFFALIWFLGNLVLQWLFFH